MSQPPLFIIDRGDTFVVRGNAWTALKAAGIKPFYAGGSAMGFMADQDRLGDLCAYLDSQRISYRIHRGDVAPPVPGREPPSSVTESTLANASSSSRRADDGQVDLFAADAAQGGVA